MEFFRIICTEISGAGSLGMGMHLGGNKVDIDVDNGDVTDYSSYHLLNCD